MLKGWVKHLGAAQGRLPVVAASDEHGESRSISNRRRSGIATCAAHGRRGLECICRRLENLCRVEHATAGVATVNSNEQHIAIAEFGARQIASVIMHARSHLREHACSESLGPVQAIDKGRNPTSAHYPETSGYERSPVVEHCHVKTRTT